jgi:large subunit ribosomal protein L3
MVRGIIGRKKGMTQIFTDEGKVVPVTVIETPPCRIAQVKTVERDGYEAVQLGAEPSTEKRIGKPRAGHLKKHGLPPLRLLMEFPVDSLEGIEPGKEIRVEEVFSAGDRVDVRGTSKGRGFAGTIKRHGFSRGDMTHGGMNKRRPGSIGQCAFPSRVFKGKRMAGHMGHRKVTVRNLELVRVDAENGYLLVRGAVPGPVNGEVVVLKTKKGVRASKRAAQQG